MSAFVIAGLVLGGIYAISALGLVLTYKASGVLNFAHGAIAYAVALTFFDLNSNHDMSTTTAAVVSIGLVGPAIGLLLWAVLFRFMTDSPAVVQVGVTVGLAVAIPPIAQQILTDEQVFRAPGLAGDPPAVVDVAGVALNTDQIVVLGVSVLVAVGLTVLIRATSFGLAVRAVVDSRRLSELMGTNSAFVSAGSWMIGSMLAGLAGVLVAPIIGLSPSAVFLLLLIASFAAAVAGRLTSLPLTFAGAMVLGVIQGVSVKWLPSTGVLSVGVRPSIPFAFLVLMLVLHQWWDPDAMRDRGERLVQRYIPLLPTARPLIRFGVPVVLTATLLVVPFFLEFIWVTNLALGAGLAIIFLSFTVVMGEGGMVSLCQVSFAGTGAIVTAQLVTVYGWPLTPSLVLAGLAAVPLGLLVALPALRLGTVYLALGTLAFALLMQNLVFQIDRFVGDSNFGESIARPEIGGFSFESDLRLYFLFLAVFAVFGILIWNLRRSTSGMVLSAVRTSEVGAALQGISVVRARMVAFGISAFIAGVGGGLVAVYLRRADPGFFAALVGLVWVAIIIAWGIRSIPAALLAGFTFALAPVIADRLLPDALVGLVPAFFGLGAVAAAKDPRGGIALTVDAIRSFRGRTRTVS